MTFDEWQEDIRQWAFSRGLLSNTTALAQLKKLREEVDELAEAIGDNDQEKIADGIGDCTVVLTNIALACEMSLGRCCSDVYEVISKRTGRVVDGVFQKDN